MEHFTDNHTVTQMASQGYNLAVGMLARREHSVAELRTKLSTKLSSDTEDRESLNTAINAVLDKLVDDGYLSDQRFAEAYARSRCRKGFGPERIKLELNEKGIDAELFDVALAPLEDQWQDVILHTWQKKFGLPPGDLKQKAKQQTFLRYRGFRHDQVVHLFNELDVLVADH